MAEVKTNITVTLTEQEAKLVAGLLWNVRLGSTGWNKVAADIAIELEKYFDESELPVVEFTFEDSWGHELQLGDIHTTIEVGDQE